MKHGPTCLVNRKEDSDDGDCTCGAVANEKIHERQRVLFSRTLTEEEINILIGPEGEGIEYNDPEVWLKEMKRKPCGESTTE